MDGEHGHQLLLYQYCQSLIVRFELLERDGLARIGRLELDGVEHETPAIAFIDSKRYPAPKDVLKLAPSASGSQGDITVARSEFSKHDGSISDDKATLKPGFRDSPYANEIEGGELLTLKEISSLLLDSRKFVSALAKIKSTQDLLRPLYCSVAGLPHRLALLVYCGIDVFDSIPLIMAAENGSYLQTSGVLDYGRIKELPCSCPACSSNERGKEQLLNHNYNAALNELRLVKHVIREGRLRELVETRIRADPWLVQNLRLLDLEQYDLQERHWPIKGSTFHAGSKESLTRPDIVRWRKRLEQRYKRPQTAKILLLIPCSARKPYSMSQSHARFRDALISSGRYELVHEVIVTSPLGLVPRELELFYPAKDYDIPVTGHWDRDERRLAEDMVSWLVSTQRYDLVISHLGDEREPVNSVLTDFIDTSEGNPGSRESLTRLEQTLKERVVQPPAEDVRSRGIEDMRSICRHQFGEPGDRLCEGVRISGRWPNLKIVKDGEQLGMLTGDRGMISLTMAGARLIAKSGTYCVEIDDFIPKGNLFAVGVENATPDVRIGDDVVITHRGEVRGVGVARMTAEEMILAERGEAVHVRHEA
jgi:archaeosine synthase